MTKILTTLIIGALFCISNCFGQAADGSIVGTVLDQTGSAIPGAAVELENMATRVKAATRTNETGLYRFNNILIGNYTITVTSQGFTTASVKNLIVELNKVTTVNITMEVGNVTTAVNVVEATQLIDTTTAQVSNTYEKRFAEQLPNTANPNGGVLNLSLLGAGVLTTGGFGTAEGPSVGGQRPRNNNFMIEGTDNNRKDVTGSVARVPNDAVLEFTVLQNQFSAEFGHSSGGQFNSVIRGGTNEMHGSIYEYLENRKLNSLDESFKRQGILSKPRYDQNRLGGSVGGPAIQNKLFYYGLFQYNPDGEAASNASAIFAPTAAGYATLNSMSGLSQTNLNILKQYLPAAAAQSGTRTTAVNGQAIPLGIIPVVKPAFQNEYDWLTSVDYNISNNDQLRARYVDNKIDTIDTPAHLPVFFGVRPITAKLFTLTEFHNFRPSLTNEFRAAFNRYNSDTRMPDGISYPGLDVFPNVELLQDLSLNLGPNANAPQATIESTYQLQDNVIWTKGRHDLKFGADARRLKGAGTFIQRIRGDYSYSSLGRFLQDLVPDVIAQRNNGGKPYSADSGSFYWFANDNWKATRNLALNLGVRYEYNGVAQSMKEFDLNKIADVPGVLTFAAPRPQKLNFGPRVGLAFTPGSSARTTVRAGFGIAYDQVFDNVGTNARPPQATSTVDRPVTDTPGFLAGGGIKPNEAPSGLTAAQARAATSSWLGDQRQGYSINWNFGIQRVLGKDYSIEARYLGNRGVHLIVQTQLNRIAIVTPSHQLPTYLQAPSQATLDALPLTLTALTTERDTRGNIFLPFFPANVTAYVPTGNSSYEGLALDFNKRFSKNLLFKAGYTWSHAIDDSAAEVNSTVLTPRRGQDFFNRSAERGSSLLDRRQRFVFTWIYETPWFRGSKNFALKNVLGGYSFSGTYSAESPEWGTVQSGVDSNLNGDAAADRAILNPNGAPGTSSDVTPLCKGGACPAAGAARNAVLVGYLAVNPNAQFIRAQVGTYADLGKNVLPTKGINNFDVSVAKNVSFTERWKLNFRADFRNALNHPQYAPGQINNITFRSGLTATTSYLTPGNPDFGKFDRVFRSNARFIQLGAVLRF